MAEAGGIDSGTLPWTRSCFVCGEDNPHGLRLRSRVEEGCVRLDYTPRDSDRGWQHIVHGGITMTLLDEVMTWAAILEARAACVAAEVTVRLRRPIAVRRALRVEGRVVSARGRIVFTEGAVLDGDGALLASASGKYLPMPAGQVALCEKDFVSSPDAIDPARILGLPGRAASPASS